MTRPAARTRHDNAGGDGSSHTPGKLAMVFRQEITDGIDARDESFAVCSLAKGRTISGCFAPSRRVPSTYFHHCQQRKRHEESDDAPHPH
jgi:hypothetical protein